MAYFSGIGCLLARVQALDFKSKDSIMDDFESYVKMKGINLAIAILCIEVTKLETWVVIISCCQTIGAVTVEASFDRYSFSL